MIAMKIKCLRCQKNRQCIKKGQAIYSANGRKWDNGNCSSCVYDIKRMLLKKAEQEFEMECDLYEPQKYHAHKKCKKCAGPIETSRYFECETCKPELPSDYSDEFISAGLL